MAIALTHLEGRAIAVFGLARSGLSAVSAALAGGAVDVLGWDDSEEARMRAEELGAIIEEPTAWPWERLDCLVLSPGVPLTHPKPHPIVDLARHEGVEIVSDVELLWREAQGRVRLVGITGTNGKSTTAALLAHVLADAGMPVSLGGNIGRAALDLEPLAEGRVYVLELSSYQLDLTRRFRPDVAIWLNLTPDHLERHGSMAGYAKAKARIFLNMAAEETGIVGVDEPEMQAVARAIQFQGRPRLLTMSVTHDSETALYVDAEGTLFEEGTRVASLARLAALRGQHNWQNAAAAWGAAKALGVAGDTILEGMTSFGGLAHRMQVVGRRGSVLFINDSKATNADAAAHALASFDAIYWVAGGLAKEGGIAGLAEYFPRITKAYLIGSAAEAYSETLARRVPHVIAGDMGTAVRMAAEDASIDRRAEPVVLLSPAAASFDQFADFEARGEAFVHAVKALEQIPTEAVA